MNGVYQAFTSLVIALLVVAPGGCATGLPTYPPLSDADSLRMIAARLESVRSISASVDLTLTNAQGQTVALEGAFVARPPDHARLRAWKFGSPVLDLTILPGGVWAFAATRDGSPSTDMTTIPAMGVSQSIELLSGAYFAGAHAVDGKAANATLVVVGTAFGRDDARCEIDRATLTPRRFLLTGGETGMVLLLDRYSLIGGVVWARRMEFRSADGTIVMHLGDVELNGELPENAFVPPGRAVRLP